VLTLALGIGLSTAAFSMANTLLLRTLPYPDGEHLVRIFRTSQQAQTWPHAPANYLDIRSGCTSFAGMAGYCYDSAGLAEPGQPAQQMTGMTATAEFFNVLGVHPVLGRTFLPDEDQPGKGGIVILTHRTWVRRFGSDPAIINRTLRLNAEPVTIIGVLPADFEAPLVWGPVEYVRPLTLWPSNAKERSNAWYHCLARLKPGTSLAQAQSELTTVAARLDRAYPKENGTDGLRAVDLHSSNMDGFSRNIIWLVVGLSVAVLLIACANLASLQVARAFGRSREYAIRSALGGGRRQLMGPLLLESLLLALLGGMAGLLVGSWTTDLIGRSLLINNEPGLSIPLDQRVLLFTVISSLASGLAFGLAPAWLASRAPAAEAMKEGSRGATAGRSHQHLKNALIVGELALALVLVGIAASFSIGAKAFSHRNNGWQPDGLYSGYISMPYSRYKDDEQCRVFHRALLERLAAIPGVEHTVLTSGLPVYSYSSSSNLIAEGQSPVERGREPLAQSATVTSDFFTTLRIPLKQGTFFPPDLRPDSPTVVIINEALARRFWPGEPPIGKRLRIVGEEPWRQVVGVVGDVGMAVNFNEPETRLHLYLPLIQAPNHFLAIVLRGSVAPEALPDPVRKAVASLDPDMPVSQGGSLRAEIDTNLANIDVIIANLGTFAVMGLLLAALGLYGVISQLTAQRTRDIGVRIALGAQYRDIMAMVMRQGIRLLIIGALVGIPVYLLMNFGLQRAMPEMHLPGLWLLGTTLLLLCAAVLFACWLPARRAARINPVEALRAE
jgi:putative ABC transport system permease protein